MKQPVSIRDKFASKRKRKRVFRRLATCERRALYLRCASCSEILPPPRLLGKISLPPTFRGKIYRRHLFLAKFYLVSAFLSIVRTSATASFGVKFHRRAQPVFNRAVCFVMNFTAVRAWFNRRLFVANACSKQSPPSLYRPTFTSSPPSRKF